MRLPGVGELVAIEKERTVLVVIKRRDLKNGSKLWLVGATIDFVVTKETKPMRRLPAGWTVLDSEAAYERLEDPNAAR